MTQTASDTKRLPPTPSLWDPGYRTSSPASTGTPSMAPQTPIQTESVDRWENEGGEIPSIAPRAVSTAPENNTPPLRELFVLSFDGLLAPRNPPIDAPMATLLKRLLDRMKVAIILGENWPRFETHILSQLPADARTYNLVLIPTSSANYDQYEAAWIHRYAHSMNAEAKLRFNSPSNRYEATAAGRTARWNDLLEHSGSQMTLSPLKLRNSMTPSKTTTGATPRRKAIETLLTTQPEGFSAGLGKGTFINVAKPHSTQKFSHQELREIFGVDDLGMYFCHGDMIPINNPQSAAVSPAPTDPSPSADDIKRVIERLLSSHPAEGAQ